MTFREEAPAWVYKQASFVTFNQFIFIILSNIIFVSSWIFGYFKSSGIFSLRRNFVCFIWYQSSSIFWPLIAAQSYAPWSRPLAIKNSLTLLSSKHFATSLGVSPFSPVSLWLELKIWRKEKREIFEKKEAKEIYIYI